MAEEKNMIEKIEQPAFSVKPINVMRPTYNKKDELVWKAWHKEPERPKKYKQYSIKKIQDTEKFIVREDILEQTRQLFKDTGKLIPVCLNTGRLKNGYEQILIAKEIGRNFVTYIEAKATPEEIRMRHKRNQKKEQEYRREKKKRQAIKRKERKRLRMQQAKNK